MNLNMSQIVVIEYCAPAGSPAHGLDGATETFQLHELKVISTAIQGDQKHFFQRRENSNLYDYVRTEEYDES